MRVFCDTSVLVAALVPSHEHHEPAFSLLERIRSGRLQGFIAAHSLAEMYSVLTRMPLSPPLLPELVALLIEDNILPAFSIRTLLEADYVRVVLETAKDRVPGGMIHDALILACAVKAKADRIYTFNVGHFRRLAPELHKRIMAP
jgi:predicted nucleic acid-binding protein